MDQHALTDKVKAKAQELGFELVGVTSPAPPENYSRYESWLEAGLHGEMGYLATERARQRRADPLAILPECKSILVLGMPHHKPTPARAEESKGPQGRLAAYAWGEDYHDVLKKPLQEIVAFIESELGESVANRWYTDTGPILERELAQRAGLGWIGKNSMLINPASGSYYLLAEILLGIELAADQPFVSDHCGTCTRCLEACPTDCILPDRTVDATRCISYLTIELKSAIPANLRGQMEDWVFGCDICQEVCPWNQRFASPGGHAAFASRPQTGFVELEGELSLSREQFNRKFKGSPVKRSKRRGYLRNVSVALGNAAQQSSVAPLSKALQDEEPLVRGHAAWALGRIGGEKAEAALKQAAVSEQDDWVKAEIEAALAG